MALTMLELVILVFQCIVVEAQDLWNDRENYRSSWQRCVSLSSPHLARPRY
jgi:hypothetical protein